MKNPKFSWFFRKYCIILFPSFVPLNRSQLVPITTEKCIFCVRGRPCNTKRKSNRSFFQKEQRKMSVDSDCCQKLNLLFRLNPFIFCWNTFSGQLKAIRRLARVSLPNGVFLYFFNCSLMNGVGKSAPLFFIRLQKAEQIWQRDLRVTILYSCLYLACRLNACIDIMYDLCVVRFNTTIWNQGDGLQYDADLNIRNWSLIPDVFFGIRPRIF